MPGIILTALHAVTHLILTTNLTSRCCYFFHFTNEEMKVREVSDLPKESGGPRTPEPCPQAPCCPMPGAQVFGLEPLSHSTRLLTFGELLDLQRRIHQLGMLPDSPSAGAAG